MRVKHSMGDPKSGNSNNDKILGDHPDNMITPRSYACALNCLYSSRTFHITIVGALYLDTANLFLMASICVSPSFAVTASNPISVIIKRYLGASCGSAP